LTNQRKLNKIPPPYIPSTVTNLIKLIKITRPYIAFTVTKISET